MRLLHIIMAAITIAFGVGLLMWRHHGGVDLETAVETTRIALEKIDAQIKFRAAVSRVHEATGGETTPDQLAATGEPDLTTPVNQRGWPMTIEPEWFGTKPPLNALTIPGCPWVEIASGEELLLTNPRIRVALDRNVAAFWYNPALGIVRARVGPTATDVQAVDLYNRVNATAIVAIVDAPEFDLSVLER
ncbi:MAG: hypothetical protein ACKVZJ_05995 [Phycisphaerales bacterium]